MEAQETWLLEGIIESFLLLISSLFFFFWIFQNWEKDQEVEVGVDNTTWQILAHQPLLYAKLLWRKLTLDIGCQRKTKFATEEE